MTFALEAHCSTSELMPRGGELSERCPCACAHQRFSKPRWPPDQLTLRTGVLDRIRTCDIGARIAAFCPLNYENDWSPWTDLNRRPTG